jgi:hypothetical protein
MASGHVTASTGRTHGRTDQCCEREKNPCQLGVVHTWHFSDVPSGRSNVCFWEKSGRGQGVIRLLHLTQLRHRNCSRAAVDTPSDGVHAQLARSAFEAVSATNLVPINNRAASA